MFHSQTMHHPSTPWLLIALCTLRFRTPKPSSVRQSPSAFVADTRVVLLGRFDDLTLLNGGPKGKLKGLSRVYRGCFMRRWAPADARHWEPGWQSGYVARSSRWQRKGGEPAAPADAAATSTATSAESLWYFGFGANINPWKLRERRKIIPIDQVCGRLPGWRLTFNHKGGMGNIERLDSPALTNRGPDEVHGMLLHLSARDFEKLSAMEYEYGTTDVLVSAYDGREIAAKAFVSSPEWKLAGSLPPPERYLKLIRDGCSEMGIDSAYQNWLRSLQSQKGQRGAEYWTVAQPSKKQRTPSVGRDEMSAGPLCLGALQAFAVPCDLVDIGANLGKCSEQDLAAQLVRAAAAKVNHVILTGCDLPWSP